MKKFVESSEFAALNVGFSLDEGLASTDDSFSLYYGERTLWRKSCHTKSCIYFYLLTFLIFH